jgi:2-hydroxycyclohexanecarboxyl-CoA dehydrogenase
MRLKGKKALIIGAAGQGNMGQSIARRLVKEGAKVCVAGRNKAILKELAKELNGHYALSDITIRNDIETMVTEARSNLGKIDIAINATGWGLTKKFLNTNEEELDRMTAIQFKGPYFFMQSVISEMIKNGGGSIIQISSGTAVLPTINHTAYAGTKAGIDHVIKSLANEFGENNIRINSISPGLTKTPMTENAFSVPGIEEAFLKSYPMGRLGTSEDVSAMCVYLASDECFMTGQNLQVNGGLTLRRNPNPKEIAESIAKLKKLK